MHFQLGERSVSKLMVERARFQYCTSACLFSALKALKVCTVPLCTIFLVEHCLQSTARRILPESKVVHSMLEVHVHTIVASVVTAVLFAAFTRWNVAGARGMASKRPFAVVKTAELAGYGALLGSSLAVARILAAKTG